MKRMTMAALAMLVAAPMTAAETAAPAKQGQRQDILLWGSEQPRELLLIKADGRLVWKADKNTVARQLISEIAKREDAIAREAKEIEALRAQVKELSARPESCPAPAKAQKEPKDRPKQTK